VTGGPRCDGPWVLLLQALGQYYSAARELGVWPKRGTCACASQRPVATSTQPLSALTPSRPETPGKWAPCDPLWTLGGRGRRPLGRRARLGPSRPPAGRAVRLRKTLCQATFSGAAFGPPTATQWAPAGRAYIIFGIQSL
jgi:hypothetical protein